MALASTRPIVGFAERSLRDGREPRRGDAGGVVGHDPDRRALARFVHHRAGGNDDLRAAPRPPVLRPAAERAAKYATLGLLFVNVSIGGTLTSFAAPPVLMVARPWGWDIPFMLTTSAGAPRSRSSFRPGLLPRSSGGSSASLRPRPPVPTWSSPKTRRPRGSCCPFRRGSRRRISRSWCGPSSTAHYPALFLGGFLFFLGFARATAEYQSRIELKTPLLVGFLPCRPRDPWRSAGLVDRAGAHAVCRRRRSSLAPTLLTAFNDNALITYLATLVPNLDQQLKLAMVEGAVTGGGLTVIANAPNPAGQALLTRFFDGAILPLVCCSGRCRRRSS